MRVVVAAMLLFLCLCTLCAQTFVPRFNRPPTARNDASSVFGAKSDLETSIGRVAEAPKLMPQGASASMASDDLTARSAPSTTLVAFAGGAFAAAVLAAGTVGWRLRARSQG